MYGNLKQLAWHAKMPFPRMTRRLRRIAVLAMKIVGVILFTVYIVVPLIFRFSSTVQRHLIFLPLLRYPHGIDLTKPNELGLQGALHLKLQTDPDIEVGVWYIPPNSLVGSNPTISQLDSGHPVIVYLHGNSGSRANSNRLELYKLLQSLDYHIVTFDYRGYADSTPTVITEDGVVRDAHEVIRFVEEKKGNSKMIIWGHSLGTGVGSRVSAELCKSSRCPAGLILEAPFNNLQDEIRYHPFSYIFRFMPFFEFFFLDGLPHSGIEFSSDVHIGHVTSPIMIMHAEDDAVVPFHLGKKLFEAAKLVRDEASHIHLKFVEFEGRHQYGHKFIYKAPELPSIIGNFVNGIIGKNTAE